MKQDFPSKRKIYSVADIFSDASVRSVGVISDVHQGKTNTLNHIVKALQERYDASIWAAGLRVEMDGVEILNSVQELESIYNSVVIVDEFPDLFDLSNAKQQRDFEKSMRKIYHSNNILVICGLPRNFNLRLGAMLQAVIFKQSTLTDFIQRSPTEQAIKSYSSAFGSDIQKGSNMLTMPKNRALYHEIGSKHWWDLDVPYMESVDAKRFNPPILRERPVEIDLGPRFSLVGD
jgi:hypothetical protein